MPMFRKKAAPVEAFRYYVDPRPDWFQDRVTTNEIITYPTHCDIGNMRVDVGDYIVRNPDGAIGACKARVFEMLYEPSEPTP